MSRSEDGGCSWPTGKGGHQRLVPISPRFFFTVGAYLEQERPSQASTDRLFVVLKGPRQGQPLTPAGVDEVLRGARRRAGLEHEMLSRAAPHLSDTAAGSGHGPGGGAGPGRASLDRSRRIYLHLADDWLAGEYRRAAEVIDAQRLAGADGNQS
jgi:integrase/recombinase XerD